MYALHLQLVGKPVVEFLFIIHKWFFFVISYGWDVIGGNLSKSACFEGGGSLWAQISDGKSRHPWTTVGVRKLEWLPFRTISKYPQCVLWFCHKACVWRTDRGMDRRTERQNCDSFPRAPWTTLNERLSLSALLNIFVLLLACLEVPERLSTSSGMTLGSI